MHRTQLNDHTHFFPWIFVQFMMCLNFFYFKWCEEKKKQSIWHLKHFFFQPKWTRLNQREEISCDAILEISWSNRPIDKFLSWDMQLPFCTRAYKFEKDYRIFGLCVCVCVCAFCSILNHSEWKLWTYFPELILIPLIWMFPFSKHKSNVQWNDSLGLVMSFNRFWSYFGRESREF